MKISNILIATCLLYPIFGTSAEAAIVTFNFISTSGNGNDLDGLASCSTSASDAGITLTLDAVANVAGGSGTFNRNGTSGSSLDFGINAAGAGDETDAIDSGNGIESMVFTVNASVPLSDLRIQSVDFDRFTNGGGDAVRIALNGSPGATFNSDDATNDTSGLINLDQALSAGDTFSFEYAAGSAGFGLEFITFSATAVPEPSSLAVLGLLACGAGIRARERKFRKLASC